MSADAVIFDIDGTLIDSVQLHAEAWQEAFARFGVEVPLEKVRAQIGKGGDHLLPVFLSKEQLEMQGKEIEEFRGELFKEKYLPRVRPFPRVRELFERIRSDGKRISLATSAKSDEIGFYKRLAGVEDLVEQEASSDDAKRSKPDPDIVVAALHRLGSVPPQRAVLVGDSPYDAEAAQKAGVPTIGLRSGGFDEATLRGAGCVAIYEDPSDLLAHYSESPISG